MRGRESGLRGFNQPGQSKPPEADGGQNAGLEKDPVKAKDERVGRGLLVEGLVGQPLNLDFVLDVSVSQPWTYTQYSPGRCENCQCLLQTVANPVGGNEHP